MSIASQYAQAKEHVLTLTPLRILNKKAALNVADSFHLMPIISSHLHRNGCWICAMLHSPFKARLDKYWENECSVYNYRVDY